MTNIETLSQNIEKLSPRDQEFASSLIEQSRYRTLSSNQAYWVGKLIERAEQPSTPMETKKVGDVSGAIELFDKARQHLKYPAIVLSVPDVGEVRINVAGERAQKPGSLNVVRYSDREWLGRITREGEYEASRKHDASDELMAGLIAFAQDPAGVAAEHGKLTGRCCFCNTALEDPRSTAAGFGPTCAKNYGLYEHWKDAAKKLKESAH